MDVLISTTLPVFGSILVGYLTSYFGILGQQSGEAINRFVYYVAFPSLLFVVVARTPLEEIFYWPFLSVWVGSLGVTYVITAVISFVFYRDGVGNLAVRSMNTTCSSTAFMGVPLVVTAFGNEAALPAILATIVIVTVFVSITILLIEADSVSKNGAKNTFRAIGVSLAKNPLMISVVLGVLVTTFGSLPKSIEKLGDVLGSAAIPCSLVSIGIFIAGQSVRGMLKGVTVPTVIKLTIHPLITWFLIHWVIELKPMWAATALLLSALPPATTCFVIAQRHQVLVLETSGTIWLSTLISVATVSAVLGFVGA